MTDLTEKWKAGELGHGAYYVRIEGGVLIDFFDATKLKFVRFKESAIDEVLAPVPSYEELRELKEENARLKELLKEWVKAYPVVAVTSYIGNFAKIQELLDKTNEALK